MADTISILYQFGTNASFLLLCALGLIVILGMMNIINLAHGEFMMLGAYTASAAVHQGIPLPLAVLLAAAAVGLFGVILERLIVQHFYGRELGALVVTWGISLILAQGALLAFGPFMPPIAIPGGSISVGVYSFSIYWLFLIVFCVVLLAGLAWVYRATNFGLEARAAMQNPAMARALGIRVNRIYMITFGIGSALAGLSGALLAPTTSIAPFMGQQFVAPAFITVVVGGGASVIGGAVGSSALLSLVETPVSFLLGSFWGSVALLVTALVVIRILPGGVSSLGRRLLPRLAR
ncbi:MAG TPA: branched-chain amino acid ABC transporter permease [Acidocella sp.]|jgi:branched-subunit amino acid ABC-type transport system permease component|uniref:ABC transporter permease subunit n=1 Tax=Acidocella sp. TaxID=50710 RepID=UPI002CF981F7|nr:branched-chain amino acid ABC transporter permease [Acidocella sp.]HVE23522.1 branched-chain amino acid ABC transporter permease [Acidocella sp.]